MYSIQKVTAMLGIPGVTLRAWEARHRIVNPLRTAGGHRLYSEEDVSALRWVKQRLEEGMKIGEAAQLLKQRTAPAAPTLAGGETPQVLREDYISERLYPALIAFNTEEANRIIDLALSLYGYEIAFHEILAPLLVRIGTDWEAGKIAVAQEHFASQLILQRFLHIFRSLPVDPRLPSVIAFCPPGEHHHLGLLLFSLFLRKKGVDVIYLGPDTPYEGLTEIIDLKNVRAAAVSVTDPRLFEALAAWLERALEEHASLRVLLGGAGFAKTDGTRMRLPRVSYEDGVDWEAWYRLALAPEQ